MGRPVARAAVVGGGAADAGKKHGEHKAEEQAEADRAASEAAPEAKKDDTLEQLKKLGELRDSGVLTEEEFEAKKKQLLGS